MRLRCAMPTKSELYRKPNFGPGIQLRAHVIRDNSIKEIAIRSEQESRNWSLPVLLQPAGD